MIRKVLSALVVAGVTFFGVTAFAANQQAGVRYFPLTNPQTYARGDGLYLDKTTKIPVLIGNGDGYQAIGPTYRDTFAYGEGIGATCNYRAEPQIGYWITAANTSCVTTCAAAVPVATCTFALDGGVGGACATATNDDCFCVPTASVSDCGANFAVNGTALQKGVVTFGGGMKLAYVPIGIQTLGPDMDADSLDIGLDQTNDEGAYFFTGGVYGSSGRPFIVGDDPAFQFCIDVAFADATGTTDDFHMGFFQAENIAATAPVFDDFTDVATIGQITTNITIETILAGAATVATDTTQDMVDATRYVLCTKVSDAGVVTYTINGQAPATTAAYTFADGTAVVPGVHLLQNVGTATGEVDLRLWEVRYQ